MDENTEGTEQIAKLLFMLIESPIRTLLDEIRHYRSVVAYEKGILRASTQEVVTALQTQSKLLHRLNYEIFPRLGRELGL